MNAGSRRIAALLLLVSFSFGSFHLSAVGKLGPIPGQAQQVIVKQGTEVNLKLVEPVNSQRVEEDNVVAMEVDIDVITSEGKKVIVTGAYATGVVKKVKKKGIWGKAARLELEAVSVKAVDGSTIPLESKTLTKKGKNRTLIAVGAAVAASVLAVVGIKQFQDNNNNGQGDGGGSGAAGWGFLGIGFFISGSSIEIPIGESLLAQVSEDRVVTLNPSN